MGDSSTSSTNPPPPPNNHNLSHQPTNSTTQSSEPPNTRINLRIPSKYQTSSPQKTVEWTPPPLEWLARTWSVTHSTLPMWRKAKNVRITYSVLPSSGKRSNGKEGGVICLDDTVESEPTERTLLPQPKAIRGIDTPDRKVVAAWNWRGRGWLRIASSHWEVLGWGERDLVVDGAVGKGGEKERWVVTWFAPSLFTPAGVDVYSDRKEGGSEGLVKEVLSTLEGMSCVEVSGVCRNDMRAVKID